jgi:tetratricopeptide (TPR) repeat protein
MADVTRLKNRARREEQRENWSRAIELYTQALSESQSKGSSVADLSLYNRIGDIYLRIGQKNTAVRYYEEAIERYAEQELHASAIALCNKVLRIHPARSSVYLQLGRLHLATNLIADAGAHYHRYTEAMWELGNEVAALEGLEELIEQTGDTKSVDTWVRWLSLASDREAAEARVEALREALTTHDLDADDLLARVRSADAPVAEADRIVPRDEEHEPAETPVTVASSEAETEGTSPLPLLDELPAEEMPLHTEALTDSDVELAPQGEPEPALEIDLEEADELPELIESTSGADGAVEPGAAIEPTSAEQGADDEPRVVIPWEPEDEEGHPEWESDVPEVAAVDDWGAAVELGELVDPFVGRDVSSHSIRLDTIEPGSLDPLVVEPDLSTHALDGSEASVAHPHLGEHRAPIAATFEGPEAGVVLDPPPPSHGGYSSESPEHVARAPLALGDASPKRIDGSEMLASTGHASLSKRPQGDRVEPPTTWTHLAQGGTLGFALEAAEAQDLADPKSPPFRTEADEHSTDGELPMQELVDRAEGQVTDDTQETLHPIEADAGLLEGEDPIESTSLNGGASEGSASPASPDAQSAEIDPSESLQLDEAWPSTDVDGRNEASGSWSEANEELEPTESGLDALEGDLESLRLSGSDAAEPTTQAPESQEQFVESFEAAHAAHAGGDEGDEEPSSPDDTRVGIGTGNDPRTLGSHEPEALLDAESEPAAEPGAEPAADPVEPEQDIIAVEAIESPVEPSASEPMQEEQTPLPAPAESVTDLEPLPAAPASELEPEAESELEPEAELGVEAEPEQEREPEPVSLSAVGAASPEETSSDGGGAINVASGLGGEREDAFAEWVNSASPPVLLRALTELEMRRELDKGLMVVERLIVLEPGEPELLRKRLEYASALGDSAVVVETYVSLGQCLEQVGRTFEARRAFESLLQLDPDHAAAQEAVQRLKDATDDGQLEQEEGAVLAQRREPMQGPAIGGVSGTSGYGDLAGGGVLDASGEGPQPYSGVAGGREAAADFEQLLSEFRAELHERPQQSDSMTRTELGAGLKEMGRLDDAIRELQAAVREPQAPALAYELLGEAFLDKGQARVAMRLLQQALQGSSWEEREMLGVLYQLGVAFQELGESTNALGCYERIFSVDIDYKDVQERILGCS